jgi:oligopeptide transport system ATP-binding protein
LSVQYTIWLLNLKDHLHSNQTGPTFGRQTWSEGCIIAAEIILDVRNLRTYFYVQDGELRAVDGLTYKVKKGECVALVGESACGKSVSALSVMRLIPYPPGVIVGGEIIFDGKDLLKISEQEMRHIRGNRIAMVFQEPMTSLNPVLTVSRQLSETLELHRHMDKRAAEEESIKLLRLVGIPDADHRIHDYPHQFSGGMKQRIMIAMALSCNPALLIADEPTTALDVTVQAQVLELMNNLRTQFGTAVMIITHNLGAVARYADSVNVMYAGRLMETGPTEAIYAAPRHPYTVGLIRSVPRLDLPRQKELSVIEGLPPNLASLSLTMCPFSPRCKLAIDQCRTKRPELEMVGTEHRAACFRSRDVPKLMEVA